MSVSHVPLDAAAFLLLSQAQLIDLIHKMALMNLGMKQKYSVYTTVAYTESP